MPSQINRVPPGLLSLLGIKALGQNPALLPDQLAPVIELLPMYAASFSETITTTVAANAVGAFADSAVHTVPAGQLWLVEGLAITTDAALGAGAALRVAGLHYNAIGYVRDFGLSSFTVGERAMVSAGQARFFAGAGSTLGAWVAAIAAGPITLRISATVTRLIV